MRRSLWFFFAQIALLGQTGPPFAIRGQVGNTVSTLSEGGTLTFAADAVGIATHGSLAFTYRPSVPATTAELRALDLSGSTDLSVTTTTAFPLTLGSTSAPFSITVRYQPSTSRQQSARLSLTYVEGTGRPATVNVNLTGVAPEFAFTHTVQPIGNTTLMTSGATIALPATNIDETTSVVIAVVNKGSGPGNVNTIAIAGSPQFVLAGVPFPPATVEPTRELRFSVRFTPKQLEAASATVTVEVPGPSTVTFTVTGSGLGPVYSSDLVVPAGGPLAPGQLIRLPDAIVGGERTTATVRVRNTGNAEARIAAISIAGTGFSLADVPFLPYTLAPGASVTVKLQFTATQPGRVVGRLRIGNDNFEVEASGLGSQLSYAYTSGGGAVTVASGGTVVIPPTAFGQTVTVRFTVSNEGTAPTEVNSVSVSGSRDYALAEQPSLPIRLGAGASATLTVSFTPSAVGAISGALRLDTQSFTLSGVGNPPAALSPYKFDGASGTVEPAQQTMIGLSLDSAYPLALNGTLNLAFSSDVFAVDPAVQFATGGRTVAFTVPAGQRQAVFANNRTEIGLQTGTVAGTILVTPSFATATGAIDLTPTTPPALSLTVAPTAPRLLGIAVSAKTAAGFTVQITGFATSRSVTSMDFQFTPTEGETVATNRLTLSVEPSFVAWYASQASQAFGSLFTATVPFTLQGDVKKVTSVVDTVKSVSVTIANRQGTSSARSVELR